MSDANYKKSIKSEQNRKHYGQSKQSNDHALIRLNKGELAIIDSAAKAARLSRSAFMRLCVVPFAAAYEEKARLSPESTSKIESLGSMDSVAEDFDRIFGSS